MSDLREQSCEPIGVPDGLAALTAGYGWAKNAVGESGAAVFRLFGRPGHPDLYLKHGRGAVVDDVIDEMARLRWLAGRAAAPTVVRFIAAPDEAWLLMSEIPGETAYQRLKAGGDPRALVDALADHLRLLHQIPVKDCPFTRTHRAGLARAKARLEAGLVDAEDFDDERAGQTAETVWARMTALLPIAEDLVVAHGDYSLDNLIIRNDEVVGMIDVGRLGVADRYQDLAIAWNCLSEFGRPLQDRFFSRYGLETIDRRKLDFHLMLDEFF